MVYQSTQVQNVPTLLALHGMACNPPHLCAHLLRCGFECLWTDIPLSNLKKKNDI